MSCLAESGRSCKRLLRGPAHYFLLPLSPPHNSDSAIGLAGLVFIFGYLIWLVPRPRVVGRSDWRIVLPDLRLTVVQIGIWGARSQPGSTRDVHVAAGGAVSRFRDLARHFSELVLRLVRLIFFPSGAAVSFQQGQATVTASSWRSASTSRYSSVPDVTRLTPRRPR